jgi:hypothetical protein
MLQFSCFSVKKCSNVVSFFNVFTKKCSTYIMETCGIILYESNEDKIQKNNPKTL